MIRLADQNIINANYLYSGSSTDVVHYRGAIETQSFHCQTIYSSSQFGVLTSSYVDQPFLRQGVYSRVSGETDNFTKKNLLWSEKLGFRFRNLAGSSIKNTTITSLSNEVYWDSYVPSPVAIAKRNDVEFVFIPPESGSLEGSDNFSLPPSINDIPIFFGTTIPSKFAHLESAIDTTWLTAPWPFQSRYKNLDRIFSPNYFLPENQDLSIDITTGNTITPPSQSNLIGSLFYVADIEFDGEINQGYQIDTSTKEAIDYIPNLPLGRDFYGAGVQPYSSLYFGWVHKYYYDLLCSGDGIWMKKYNSAYWTRFYGSSGVIMQGVQSSKNSSNYHHITVGVGNNATIVRSNHFKLQDWASAPADGGFIGNFYSVDRRKTNSGLDDEEFVICGDDGEIQFASKGNVASDNWMHYASYSPAAGDKLYVVRYNKDFPDARFLFGGQLNSGASVIYFSGSPPFDNSNFIQLATIAGSPQDAIRDIDGTVVGAEVYYACGDNGLLLKCINNGNSWSNLGPPAGGFTGNFYAIHAEAEDDVYVFGNDDEGLLTQTSMIQHYDGTDWSIVEYNGANDENIGYKATWRPLSNGTLTTPSVVGIRKNNKYVGILRNVDIETTGSTFIDTQPITGSSGIAQRTGSWVNDSELMSFRGTTTDIPATSKFTRSTLGDGYKVYYGFTNSGYTVDLSEFNFTPSNLILSQSTAKYTDFKVDLKTNTLEVIRAINPQIDGFRYGIMNVSPQKSKIIWRRDHFGYFRDMLEQRPNAKFYIPPNSVTDATTQVAALTVKFVSGTNAGINAAIYLNTTSSVDFNPHDSGQWDYEYKSGQPFFDGV